jgi:hypothetical protein
MISAPILSPDESKICARTSLSVGIVPLHGWFQVATKPPEGRPARLRLTNPPSPTSNRVPTAWPSSSNIWPQVRAESVSAS